MGMNKPKDGAPGTTDQSPRWEGPQENTPPGYMPAKDDPDRAEDAKWGNQRQSGGQETFRRAQAEGRVR